MSVRSISNSQREEAVKVKDLEHAEDFDVEDAAQGVDPILFLSPTVPHYME